MEVVWFMGMRASTSSGDASYNASYEASYFLCETRTGFCASARVLSDTHRWGGASLAQPLSYSFPVVQAPLLPHSY